MVFSYTIRPRLHGFEPSPHSTNSCRRLARRHRDVTIRLPSYNDATTPINGALTGTASIRGTSWGGERHYHSFTIECPAPGNLHPSHNRFERAISSIHCRFCRPHHLPVTVIATEIRRRLNDPPDNWRRTFFQFRHRAPPMCHTRLRTRNGVATSSNIVRYFSGGHAPPFRLRSSPGAGNWKTFAYRIRTALHAYPLWICHGDSAR